MKRKTDLSFWPSFLHPIFQALGMAMNGRQLHPNVLKDLPVIDDDWFPAHRWAIRHVSGEAAKPSGNYYEITISGPRMSGQWAFRSGELADLALEAVVASGLSPGKVDERP